MIEKVIYYLLTNDAQVQALVSDKVYPSFVPLGVGYPALSYQVVSRMERTTVSTAEPTVHVRYRVQVNVLARDYDTLVDLAKRVRDALAHERGNIAGANNVTIRPEFQTLDVYNEDADFYSRNCDFLCTLSEPNG